MPTRAEMDALNATTEMAKDVKRIADALELANLLTADAQGFKSQTPNMTLDQWDRINSEIIRRLMQVAW